MYLMSREELGPSFYLSGRKRNLGKAIPELVPEGQQEVELKLARMK